MHPPNIKHLCICMHLTLSLYIISIVLTIPVQYTCHDNAFYPGPRGMLLFFSLSLFCYGVVDTHKIYSTTLAYLEILASSFM